MGRKSMADRIRESGDATRQELVASAEALETVEPEKGSDPALLAGANGGDAEPGPPGEEEPPPSPAEQEAAALYDEACRYITGVLEAVRKGEAFQVDDGFSIVSDMVASLARSEALYTRALHFDTSLRFLPQHLVNVTVYAVRLSAWLSLSRDEQVKVGATALFHDIGKALISDSIFYKKASVSKGELADIRKSVEKNREILEPFREPYPFLPLCALQVYERVDGSGYPKGLKQGEIHKYAQIVGLADLYEALTHDRPHRPGQSHFNAAKEILEAHKQAFDRNLLKALLMSFSIFPLQSYVRLNSGAVGRVTRTHPGLPTKPSVQIVFDSHGNRVWADQVLDLSREPLLYVTASVEKEQGKAVEQ